MRLGLCLWQPREDGAIDHSIALVDKAYDSRPHPELFLGGEPQVGNLIKELSALYLQFEALLVELQGVGTLPPETVERIRDAAKEYAAHEYAFSGSTICQSGSHLPTDAAIAREDWVVDLTVAAFASLGLDTTVIDRPDRSADRSDGLTVDAELLVSGVRWAVDIVTLRWRSQLESDVAKLKGRLMKEFGPSLKVAHKSLVLTCHPSAKEANVTPGQLGSAMYRKWPGPVGQRRSGTVVAARRRLRLRRDPALDGPKRRPAGRASPIVRQRLDQKAGKPITRSATTRSPGSPRRRSARSRRSAVRWKLPALRPR